jgi:NADP-dependent 3-hydroxy acid dehydrogenase YdfG
MGFAAEAHAAVAAGTGLDMDARVIVEHTGIVTARRPRPGSGQPSPQDARGYREPSVNHEAEATMSIESTQSKVLLITGASSGIGAATARQASRQGWRLVLAARSHEKLAALAEELGGPERALAVRCDVTDWEDQQRMVGDALTGFGRVDAAFANAGFGGARGFLEDTVEHWREMVLTNVYGAALTIRACLPALAESRGHLLLTSSVAGRRALPGSLYSCTKHAVTAMGEAARLELNGTGIRVTLIEPGMTDTPFFENLTHAAPLQDDDIARAVMYAISQPPHVDVNEILIRPTSQDA